MTFRRRGIRSLLVSGLLSLSWKPCRLRMSLVPDRAGLFTFGFICTSPWEDEVGEVGE